MESLLFSSSNAADIVASVYADPYIVFEAQHSGTGTAAMNHSAMDFAGVAGSTVSMANQLQN